VRRAPAASADASASGAELRAAPVAAPAPLVAPAPALGAYGAPA
jgi:hypothetical protein